MRKRDRKWGAEKQILILEELYFLYCTRKNVLENPLMYISTSWLFFASKYGSLLVECSLFNQRHRDEEKKRKKWIIIWDNSVLMSKDADWCPFVVTRVRTITIVMWANVCNFRRGFRSCPYYSKLRISTKGLIKKYVQLKNSVVKDNNNHKTQSYAFSFGEHELLR